MTDAEIIAALKEGDELNFGCHGRNTDVLELMQKLEKRGLVQTWDMSTEQETRRNAKWIGPIDAQIALTESGEAILDG